MIRFAVWCAVSTAQQAMPEKDSLREQEDHCREASISRGWSETSGPYIVPGESRTKYINLRDAEQNIPELHQMLEDAQHKNFDILVLFDFSRLRDLLSPVSQTLAAYGVQLYSLAQPTEPQDPEIYDPYNSDVSDVIQTVSGLGSRSEIRNLRRRWHIGMPGRVARGLHVLGPPPYGYRRAPGREMDRQAILVQDPARALVAVRIKDLFLAGQSTTQIVKTLRADSIPSPHGLPAWKDSTIRKLLLNPFYAGQTILGVSHRVRDPRTGRSKITRGDPARFIIGSGKHEPLWDEQTYRAILAEMARRRRTYKGQKTYRLSLLLRCAEHDRTLYAHHTHHRIDDAHRVWFCPASAGTRHWHLCVRDSEILAELTRQLVADAETVQKEIPVPVQEDRSRMLQAAVDDLIGRQTRLVDALEDGSLAPAIYAERIRALDERLKNARSDLLAGEQDTAGAADRRDNLAAIAEAIHEAPAFILDALPQAINAQLRALIEKIVVDENGGMKIFYR